MTGRVLRLLTSDSYCITVSTVRGLGAPGSDGAGASATIASCPSPTVDMNGSGSGSTLDCLYDRARGRGAARFVSFSRRREASNTARWRSRFESKQRPSSGGPVHPPRARPDRRREGGGRDGRGAVSGAERAVT